MIAYVFVKISPSLFIGAIFVFPGTVVLVKASGHTQVRSKFSFERHQGSGDVIHGCDVASVFTTFPVESHHQNLQFGPSALSANARLFCSRENGHSRSRGGGERNFRLKKYLPNTCTAVVKLLSIF